MKLQKKEETFGNSIYDVEMQQLIHLKAYITLYCEFYFLSQIIYDEGPLYVFAKSDQIRKHWIHELKNGQYLF